MESKRPKFDMSSMALELQIEILLLVPAEDLVELRRACKTWRELIDSREFVERHTERWRLKGGIIWSGAESKTARVCYLPSGHSGLPLSHLLPLESGFGIYKILDSCNGLLLVAVERVNSGFNQLLLWNPVTKSRKVLPFSGFRSLIDRVNWSLAYDASRKRYKIIGLTSSHCRILELENEQPSSWKLLYLSGVSCVKTLTRVRSPGKLHWLIQQTDYPDRGLIKTVLLSVDISTDAISVKTVANPPVSLSAEHRTVSSSGKLYHIVTSSLELEVWVMDDLYTNPAWFKYLVLREKPPVDAFCWNQFELIGILLQEGKELIMRLRTDNQTFIYDIASKQWRKPDLALPSDVYLRHVNTLIGWDEGSTSRGSLSTMRRCLDYC